MSEFTKGVLTALAAMGALCVVAYVAGFIWLIKKGWPS